MTRLALVLGMLLFATACGSSRQTVPPGQAAPAFEAQDQTGATRSLSDYAGKVVVLYFYPRDATPGCVFSSGGRSRRALAEDRAVQVERSVDMLTNKIFMLSNELGGFQAVPWL